MIESHSWPAMPPCSVIVPAHNEESGLAATLATMGLANNTTRNGVESAPEIDAPPEIDLIIACNGCHDRTAAIARHAAPHARVLDIAERGKANAINQALALARHPIVLVVDADVRITPATLAALAGALSEDGVMAASPSVRFDCRGAGWAVRAYYRAFGRHPYLRGGVGGAGVYGLSAAGHAALGRMPALIADDHFVRNRFPLSSQRRIATTADGQRAEAVVRPPASLAALIRTERRSRQGDRDVRQFLKQSSPLHAAQPATPLQPRPFGWLPATACAAPLATLVFLAVKIWVRISLALTPHSSHAGWSTLRT